MPAFDTVAPLLQATVRHKHRQLHPRFDRDVLGQMVAAWGEAADPLAGERLIAFFPLTGNDQVGTANKVLRVFSPARAIGKHLAGLSWDPAYGALVTDRAVVLRGAGHTARVPFHRLKAVDRSGGAAVAIGYSAVYVTLDDGTTFDLDLGPRLGGPMVDFLSAVLELPDEALAPPPPQPLADDDPLGLDALEAALPAIDDRTRALLDLVRHRVEAGTLPPVAARALVVRLGVHAHAALSHRGRREGAWVSALPPEALARFFGELGVPEKADGDAVLARTLPARTLKRGPYTLDVRTMTYEGVDLGAWSMLAPSTVLGHPTPHHEVEPSTVDTLHKGLLRAEARWLARVLTAPPDADLAALLAVSDAEAVEAMTEALGRPMPAQVLQRLRLPATVTAAPLPAPAPGTAAPRRAAPSAAADERPIGLVLAGALQVPAGALTMVVSSGMTWFVLLVLMSFVHRILEQIRFIDEGAVSALLLLAGTGVAGLQLAVAGPLRLIMGLLLFLPLRWAPRLVVAAAVLTGLVSLCTLDLVGVLASLGLAFAWTRPSTRAWLDGPSDAPTP